MMTKFGICHLLGLFTLAANAANHFWDEIPVSPSTTIAPGIQDDYWRGQFLRVNQEVAAARDTRLVFFGDSITWHWSLGNGAGRAVWQERFAGQHPINMGNSGDITPVMLYRLANGNLGFAPGNQPKLAVLLCGINNFIVTTSAGGKETWDLGLGTPPGDVAHAQRAIAQLFRRRLPQTRVILMGLLPVAEPKKRALVRQVNAINAALTFNPDEVVFLDLGERFTSADGSPNPVLFSDGVHPNSEGYRTWADALSPVIAKWTAAPPLAPTRIMCIGGSLTEGSDSNTSFRRHLDGMLRRGGRLIDFVGSRHRHNHDGTEPDLLRFDPEHEGHPGRDSAWFATNLPALVGNNPPDLAILELGTEDIAAAGSPDDALVSSIINNIGQAIQTLRTQNPEVRIVIAEAIPIPGREKATSSLNRRLASLADPSAGLSIAPMPPGFDTREDLAEDRPLLSASGARKIAASLSQTILALPESRPQPPPEK
jgi:beta-glucosidase